MCERERVEIVGNKMTLHLHIIFTARAFFLHFSLFKTSSSSFFCMFVVDMACPVCGLFPYILYMFSRVEKFHSYPRGGYGVVGDEDDGLLYKCLKAYIL